VGVSSLLLQTGWEDAMHTERRRALGTNRRHAPRIDSLEPRRLLSGNVTVTADADLNAQLIGDKRNNAIVITLDSSGGYLVSGVNGTTVNGVPAVVINTPSAMNFNIDLGSGNDQISFDGVTSGAFATQALTIATGKGNDIVTLSGTTHAGAINLSTGDGNDAVVLSGIHGTGDLSMLTGKGNDTVSIASTSQIDGNATLDAGKDNNELGGGASLTVTGTRTITGVQSEKTSKVQSKQKESEKEKSSKSKESKHDGEDDSKDD